MSRFTPDLAKVRAGFPTIESGEWEFIIGEAKGFHYVKDDGKEVYGVRYPLEIAGSVDAGGNLKDEELSGDQAAPFSLYLHSKKAGGMVKQWLLAALGYTIEEEDEANESVFGEHDFGWDLDEDEDPVVGDGWTMPEGRRIRMTCSVQIMDNGDKRQQYGSYVPV